MEDFSRPPFLDLLDSDPDAAFAGFYQFAIRSLTRTPPRAMRALGHEDFEDLLHEIVYHCTKEDFRVLRLYVPKGRSFAAWLYAVAHNKCTDHLRNKGIGNHCVSLDGTDDRRALIDILQDRDDDCEKRPELRELLTATKKAMAKMDERCRILLELAADEYKPEEMVMVLGLPSDQSKRLSDDLRYCREKLRKRLAAGGIDIEDLL